MTINVCVCAYLKHALHEIAMPILEMIPTEVPTALPTEHKRTGQVQDISILYLCYIRFYLELTNAKSL